MALSLSLSLFSIAISSIIAIHPSCHGTFSIV